MYNRNSESNHHIIPTRESHFIFIELSWQFWTCKVFWNSLIKVISFWKCTFRFSIRYHCMPSWQKRFKHSNLAIWVDLWIIYNAKIHTWGEKEGDLTQSYDKTPYTNRKFENKRTTPKRHQKLRLHNDYTTDLGRSGGVTSHPTGVVKPVYGYPTFPLTAKAV